MQRGAVWWADLPAPSASEPGYRHPVIIVQANAFNRSAIRTIVAVVLTSNLGLARAPGNVLVARNESGLPKDSVANVSQVITVDRAFLTEKVGIIKGDTLRLIDEGLRSILAL